MPGKLIVGTIETQNIKFDSDTTGMTIDSGGHVLTSARPFFHVYVDNGGSNPSSLGTLTIIPFDGVVSNVGGHFNTSSSGSDNHSFTAPVAGVYQFNWNLNVYGVSSGDYIRQRIFKNGSGIQYLEYNDSQTTGDQNYSASIALSLAANDYIQFYAQAQSTISLSAGTSWNVCTGYLVG